MFFALELAFSQRNIANGFQTIWDCDLVCITCHHRSTVLYLV